MRRYRINRLHSCDVVVENGGVAAFSGIIELVGEIVTEYPTQ